MFLQPLGRAAGANLVEVRSNDAARAAQFVAAAASTVLKNLLAARQLRRRRIIGGLMALTAGCLNVHQWQHRFVPVLHVAVRGSGRGGATLATVANGTAEFFRRMLLV